MKPQIYTEISFFAIYTGTKSEKIANSIRYKSLLKKYNFIAVPETKNGGFPVF